MLETSKNLDQKQKSNDDSEENHLKVLMGKTRRHALDRATGARGMECHHCGQKGHFIKDCPTAGPTCDTCGRRGHVSKKCPVRQEKKSSKKRRRDDDSSHDERDKSLHAF
jgi:hypothetical protein